MTEDYDGPERRRGYEEIAEQLDAHVLRIEEWLQKLIARALIAFAVIGVTSAVALLGFGIILKQHQNVTKEIQNQRRLQVLEPCISQNVRHDTTIARLNRAHFDKEAEQLTISLIDALAPKQNCDKLVRQQVRSAG